ncbi:hypothetical protein U9M48_044906 [Paspalum notatum var. saurae]|uniref:Transposase n=1 Tax=Paspalum notatum var. saurae TaxID=547442 RepID=A0AAQ3XIT4_PASNO
MGAICGNARASIGDIWIAVLEVVVPLYICMLKFLIRAISTFLDMGSWKEQVRQFFLDEKEDDDVFFFVILPAIMPYLSEEKESIHTSSLIGAKKVREILEGHESWCKSEFRMEPAIFKATANFHRRENLLHDTRGVTIEEQLGMFMYMISHNASNQMLQKAFQHSGETIHRKIFKVFDIVPTLTQRFVKLPRSVQTHTKIATDSRFMPFFQNCIGAIDGTHIPITIAEDRAPPYRNRKRALSHNVIVVCDFDLNFTFVSCGWEGLASDAGVLRSAISKGFSVPEGKFYLVDGGYANTPSFIAPYRGVRYHLNQFRRHRSSHSGYENYKELLNHRHAILCNHIERAIGVLKKRFPIPKVGTFHPIENQIKIAATTVAFHNIIRGQNGDEGWLDNQPDYISPSQYVDVPKGDNNYLNDAESSDGSTMIWNVVYEKGLIDVMYDHKDNPKFKGQNGWNSITTKFNEKFPVAHFSEQQLQEKEKELKGSYKAIRDSRNESGVGWNDTLCMVLAEPEVWPRLIKGYMKVVATGELNFTSTATDLAPPSAPSSRSASEQSLNPLSTNSLDLDGQETTSVLNLSTDAQSVPANPFNTNEPSGAQFVPSNPKSRQGEGGSGRKRKQSHVGSAIESYVEFKKIQTAETLEALKEKKKQEEQFSISKCQDELKVMDELTAEEKSYALELFESATNREIFLTTTEHNVREIWLRRKIRLLRSSDAWPPQYMM